MTSHHSFFTDLNSVTFQLITSCNLSCDYCFQDACNVSSSQGDAGGVVDPHETARTLIELLEMSETEMGMVFSGGEPMLVPVDWYRTFFDIMDGYLQRSGKKLEYSVQTNISILRPEIVDLFKDQGVHFSVHYDGELDDPKLLSRRRRDNIVTLFEKGFPVTVLVVGTVESLKALPSSIEFFNRHGIRFYRINYVSSEGRGHQVSRIPPALRAEAEFQAAFLASQLDFSTRDNVVLNKFLFYHNNVICGSRYKTAPRPQQCRAGVISAYVAADGYIYPCSFFPGITGPMAAARDLTPLKGARRAIALCETSHSYYDRKCPECEALPICGEYCALSPVTDTNFMESFCSAQVTLRRMMDENREIAELIAKRFIEHKQAYPADVPRSCGTRTT
ncbi:MAG: 4Fe-4S cluster-binding domain-containing protein [Syntrophorhabdaceae bacterium]|nr:4Fe-4S cluster-binding domain-containing protein [Syntrophorhabdaceae bacterium]